MTESHLPVSAPIGDELLSAYIDGQVTDAERQRAEQALATDAQVRERYESLQMTVDLMQNAPAVRVPHAFVLSEAQVLAAGGNVKGAKQPGFFEQFFPRLMPLATAAVALLLVVLVSVDFLPGFTGGMGAPQAAIQELEIASAPAQDVAVLREMPAESAAEEVAEMAMEVESTIVVEKEMLATEADEALAKREDVISESSAADEAPAARAAAKISDNEIAPTPLPLPTSAVAEAPLAEAPMAAAPMAAAPPPAEEADMAADEAETIMQAAGEVAETFDAAATAQTAPVEEVNRQPAWLRPLEYLLALVFVCLLLGTLYLRKQARADKL